MMTGHAEEDETILRMIQERDEYVSTSDFAACMERMKWYERENPSTRVKHIASMFRARCAFDDGNFAEARSVIDSLRQQDLSSLEAIYVDKLRIIIMERVGEFVQARSLLFAMLPHAKATLADDPETYYETLALAVRILAKTGDCEIAIRYFDEGEGRFERGTEFDVSVLSKAYCLNKLGRYAETEVTLKRLLKNGSGEYLSNIYYDLGILYAQTGRPVGARSMLESAAANISHGERTMDEINDAIAKLNTAVTKTELLQ